MQPRHLQQKMDQRKGQLEEQKQQPKSKKEIQTATTPDITFHPLISRRCQLANKCAVKKLSIDMEKLNLEHQKRDRRVEQERENLCQKLLDLEQESEQDVSPCNRKFSEQYPLRKRIINRSQTSDLSISINSPQSPIKFPPSPSYNSDEFFPHQSTEVRRSKSVKTRSKATAFAFDPVTDPLTNRSQQDQRLFRKLSYTKAPLGLKSNTGASGLDRRLSMSQLDTFAEPIPDWHLALANKRRERLAQLQVFREQGHWPDFSHQVSALLTGCQFSPVPPGCSALSHSSDASSQPPVDQN